MWGSAISGMGKSAYLREPKLQAYPPIFSLTPKASGSTWLQSCEDIIHVIGKEKVRNQYGDGVTEFLAQAIRRFYKQWIIRCGKVASLILGWRLCIEVSDESGTFIIYTIFWRKNIVKFILTRDILQFYPSNLCKKQMPAEQRRWC